MVEEEIVQDDFEDIDLEDIEEEEEDEPKEQPKDPYADLTPEQLKERLAKAEKAIVKNKRDPKPGKPPVTKKSPDKDEIPQWAKEIQETNTKRDFGYQRNLSPETVDAIFRYNGGQPPSDELMESDEAIKAIVRSFEGKKRIAANTPKGGTPPTYKGKTYAEIVTDKDMTPAEKQKAFEAHGKARGIK